MTHEVKSNRVSMYIRMYMYVYQYILKISKMPLAKLSINQAFYMHFLHDFDIILLFHYLNLPNKLCEILFS